MVYLRNFYGDNLSAHDFRPVSLVFTPRFADNLQSKIV